MLGKLKMSWKRLLLFLHGFYILLKIVAIFYRLYLLRRRRARKKNLMLYDPIRMRLEKKPRTCWKQSRFIMLLHVSTVFPPLFMTFVEHQFCFLPWLSSRSLRAEFFTFVRCRAQYVSSSIGRHYRRHLTRFSLKALSALPRAACPGRRQ